MGNVAHLSPAKEAQLQQFIQSWRNLFGADNLPPTHELEAFCFRNDIGEDSASFPCDARAAIAGTQLAAHLSPRAEE